MITYGDINLANVVLTSLKVHKFAGHVVFYVCHDEFDNWLGSSHEMKFSDYTITEESFWSWASKSAAGDVN